MSKNNKSLASQALLEMEDIKNAIKEESKKTLKSMLSEAVKDVLRESVDDEEDEDYEVIDNEDDAKSDDKKGKKSESCRDGECEGDIEEDGDLENDPNAAADPNAQPVPDEGPDAGAEGEMGAEDAGMGAEQGPEAGAEGEDGNGWSDFEQYQTGDNEYDLTGVNDPGTVLKAYKLLKDDDQVVVKKEGNMINIQDNDTGSEYIVDLGEDDTEVAEGEEEMGDINEGLDFDDNDFVFNDDNSFGHYDSQRDIDFDRALPDDDDDDLQAVDHDPELDDMGNNMGDDFDSVEDGPEASLDEPAGFNDQEDEEFNNRFEGKKSRKTMKESKRAKKGEMLFEIDLGYTDNYQSKDPIQGLSNSEPSKSGKSWEKGVPTGTEKPWAGETKSKGDPFKKTQKVQGSVNEEDLDTIDSNANAVEEPSVDEGMNVGGKVQQRSSSKSKVHQVDDEHFPDNIRHYTKGTDYKERKHMDESLNKFKKENKMLKEAVKELRKNLNEAYITNVNLGKITKLFLENAVSQEEKVNIINRFVNEAKTVDQSKQLFESISKDLQKVAKTNITESRMTAEGSKKLNENTIYKSQDLLNTLDFMKRMENL